MYQYINDQTLRLANHGYKMTEIAEGFVVPDSLAKEWYLRGYYGTINHNVKATYVKYLGWYDSNPATLHPLTDVEASQRYVEFMGGADAVISKARAYFARGDYRWVAQVVNHVVLAEPTNKAARDLQADTLEQLGYQAESGPWRNEYLTAAQELRHGIKELPAASSFNPDTLASMSADLIFDYLAVRLNGPKAAGRRLGLVFNFTDNSDRIGVLVENGVLHHGANVSGSDATVSLNRVTLGAVLMKKISIEKAMAAGAIQVAGNAASFREFLALLDDFPFWFPIVTPNSVPRTASK